MPPLVNIQLKYRFTDHLSKFFCLLSIASNMKAFVAGATETGRRIVQDLKRNIPVRALVETYSKPEQFYEAAELVVGDVLKPGSLSAAIADSTVLLCYWRKPALIQLDHKGGLRRD